MELKNKISKLTLIVILIGISFGFKTQSSEFSFTDKYGNEITIQNTGQVPELISIEFLKNNLNGKQFTFKRKKNAKLKFDYRISEFLLIDKMEYRIKVSEKSKSDKREDIVRNTGFSYYRMKLKKTNNGIELLKVEFIYAEL